MSDASIAHTARHNVYMETSTRIRVALEALYAESDRAELIPSDDRDRAWYWADRKREGTQNGLQLALAHLFDVVKEQNEADFKTLDA
jgi:hypothetical protein